MSLFIGFGYFISHHSSSAFYFFFILFFQFLCCYIAFIYVVCSCAFFPFYVLHMTGQARQHGRALRGIACPWVRVRIALLLNSTRAGAVTGRGYSLKHGSLLLLAFFNIIPAVLCLGLFMPSITLSVICILCVGQAALFYYLGKKT